MRFSVGPIFAVALIFASLSNPTMPEYASWAKQQVTATEGINPLIGLIASVAAEPVIQATTRRQNYIVFSVFTTQLDAANSVTVIGLANSFILLPKLQTPWRPGIPSPNFPHVIAASTPDSWKPEDGYVWIVQPPNGDLRVKWQPGRSSENFPHVVSTTEEERWVPDDGYAWNVDPPPVGQLGVHWVAGKQSSKMSHVVSASVEGRWYPATGFRWLTNPPPPGDLRVVPLVPISAAEASSRALTTAQIGAMLTKCSEEADARGLLVEAGFAEARSNFRRECMSKMGVETSR